MDGDSDLIDIYDAYRTSKHFRHLREQGPLVPGVGPSDARVMIIGDAPGASEVNSGEPFTGASGKILNQLLGLAGLLRTDVFMTYVVKFRTPGNRPPSTSEVLRSIKYLRREWMVVQPLVTIAVGRIAAAAIEAEDGVHGGLFPYWYNEETRTQHLVTIVYHPAFGRKSKKARTWIEKEWMMLGDELYERARDVLCVRCHGLAVRGRVDCSCVGTIA